MKISFKKHFKFWYRLLAMVTIILAFVTIYFVQISYDFVLPEDIYQNGELKCKFPDINALDPTILEYINHPQPLECSKMQPFLSFVDSNGVLNLNQTELRILKSKNYTEIKCCYQTFDRGSADHKIDYDSKIDLIEPISLTKDLVLVTCSAVNSTGVNITNFYFNLHAHPAKKNKKFAYPTDQQLSVLIMAIDSISLSMLKRNMPLTYDYVTREMGMIMLDSFNKVGDNTLPNMVAALTGKRLFDEQSDMSADLTRKLLKSPSDHLPLIWKLFAEKGYATVFNEDRPDIGMFGVGILKQFQQKAFDYYYPTYWRAVQGDFRDRGLSHFTTYCFRNFRIGDIFVDITKRHVMAMKDYLQFIYSFFVYYSHEDDGIMIENADHAYRQFFRESFEGGFLNKTVVIFMADHGQRFSSMRKTIIGLLEERNPMYGMWFPEWFYKLHPHIKYNLLINSKRLASTFDIHETLKDVLNANYEEKQRTKEKRGVSLLYPLPLDRDCTSAGIPRQYCLCFKQSSLNTSAHYLEPLAETLMGTLNDLLNEHDQCAEIKSESVIRAESLDFDEKVKSGIRQFDNPKKLNEIKSTSKPKSDKADVTRIRLAVMTQPNNALFEALVVRNETSQTWTVEGDIQRLTAYKNTSHCIDDVHLKKYCTCKDVLK